MERIPGITEGPFEVYNLDFIVISVNGSKKLRLYIITDLQK